jgi:hypothetical protein
MARASSASFLASANGSVIDISCECEYPVLSHYSAASLWRRPSPNQRRDRAPAEL